ncbi:hypothetical protein JTB14_030062 [Gonioctena quinquepunctata]|nr:hypothetical protein JTB14_030062 [Gonioctena quinquepunctata]
MKCSDGFVRRVYSYCLATPNGASPKLVSLETIEQGFTVGADLGRAVEVRLSLEVEEFGKRLEKLEEENAIIQEKLEQLERKSKDNNIAIFGQKHPGQGITVDHELLHQKQQATR